MTSKHTDRNREINKQTSKHDRHQVSNSWSELRKYTNARIGLGRTGTSLPTSQLLSFQFDHANAKDAVHIPLDHTQLMCDLDTSETTLILKSMAQNRTEYLQRPDFGRRLSADARDQLSKYYSNQGYDIAFAIADGLSSIAIQRHAPKMMRYLLEHFENEGMAIAPISIVLQGRVAIGDDIASTLNAKCIVLLIGERPGLSSPDSLGIYYTFSPTPGLTDANRNCISNIRNGGLSYAEAAAKVIYLTTESLKLGKSGVDLKDNMAPVIENEASRLLENPYLFPVGKRK
ncbi:MAG: ethanolamine ammonia-lyase subunit EutC [Pseudomonadota bacterium]